MASHGLLSVRWALLVAVLLPLTLAGCSKCPDYGPYAVWTDQDLHRHLAARLGEEWGPVASKDPAIQMHGSLQPGYPQFGPLDTFELKALWGDVGAQQLRRDLGDGRSITVVSDRSIATRPIPVQLTQAEAHAFLAAIMDEPDDVLFDWSGRLSSSGWLMVCEFGSCDGAGDVRPLHETAAWRLRLPAFFEEQRPWATVPSTAPVVDEQDRRVGFEAGAEVASGPWTLSLNLPIAHVEGMLGDQPFSLRVAADGVAAFNLANQPWGDPQTPRPKPADLEPALHQVLRAVGWERMPGPDFQSGPGRFSVLCAY